THIRHHSADFLLLVPVLNVLRDAECQHNTDNHAEYVGQEISRPTANAKPFAPAAFCSVLLNSELSV
ncbi:MAG: hypothetical protein LBR13_02490, partial [Dysgonamonadaceae bacterium]|nr:hypothetical protein [Dysgonamonadaceae bacterium]